MTAWCQWESAGLWVKVRTAYKLSIINAGSLEVNVTFCIALTKTHSQILETYSRHHRFCFWNHLVSVIVGKWINKCLSGNVWSLAQLALSDPIMIHYFELNLFNELVLANWCEWFIHKLNCIVLHSYLVEPATVYSSQVWKRRIF